MWSNDSDDWPDNFHVWHVLTSRLLFDSYDSYAIFFPNMQVIPNM